MILFEDEHLLVVNKPAGLNTHAPAPYAGEGLYEWLRSREPRWASLAIIHRLDKETSGVLVFSKTPEANRSLTAQFAQHRIRKIYRLLTDRAVSPPAFAVVSALVRVGDKYESRPAQAGAEVAETRFRVIGSQDKQVLVEAQPVTGRTHQIRVQAAERGFPILGDGRYGGTPAARLCLHAAEITLQHPATAEEMCFAAPVNFSADIHFALRWALLDHHETNAVRLVHGAADGWPGWYVDRLGDFLLSQGEAPLTEAQDQQLIAWLPELKLRGAYHKILRRHVRQSRPAEVSPKWVAGEVVPDELVVRENRLHFVLRFGEGYSIGLFLDQRENRRRFLMNRVTADFPLFELDAPGAQVLNVFAYTCGFSVCAAKTGARVTSVDLSKKYLDWGRLNFALNSLDPAEHAFIYGDAFDWLRRFQRKRQVFDTLVLDPPTFSTSKESGTFNAERDYGSLLIEALPLVKPGGVLLACSNAARLKPEEFLRVIGTAVQAARRQIQQQHYVPQPPDFPVDRAEPAYLKTVWLRLS